MIRHTLNECDHLNSMKLGSVKDSYFHWRKCKFILRNVIGYKGHVLLWNKPRASSWKMDLDSQGRWNYCTILQNNSARWVNFKWFHTIDNYVIMEKTITASLLSYVISAAAKGGLRRHNCQPVKFYRKHFEIRFGQKISSILRANWFRKVVSKWK